MQTDEDRIAAELAAFIRRLAPADVLATLDATRNEPVYPEYINDPDKFVKDILGLTFWQKQRDIAGSVRDNKATCVVASHSIGKTFCAAALGLWWLSSHEKAKLVTVAPTHVQLNNLLWHTMRQFAKSAKKRIPGDIYDTPRWEFGSKQRLAFGLSPKKSSELDVVSMQGAHDEYLMVILEEAGGLSRFVWDATLSLVTSDKNRLLVIGNPIGESGPFYDASKSPNYKNIHVSCFEHPNVVEGRDVIPGAVSRGWVEERLADWCRPTDIPGPTSFEWRGQWYDPLPVFQSRVLGLFAAEQADQLIALSWVESAIARWQEAIPVGERVIGMDIARFGGAESAMVFRIGDAIQWIKRRRGNDIAENVGWLISAIQETGAERAFVDDIGIGCFDDKTDILTEDGWMSFPSLLQSRSKRVLTMNPETRGAFYAYPTDYIMYPHTGKMYLYDGQTVNFCITANHQMFYRSDNSREWRLTPLEDIRPKYLWGKRDIKWQGREKETFILNGAEKSRTGLIEGNSKKRRGTYILYSYKDEQRVLKMDTWLSFLGWYISEGSLSSKKGIYQVAITQKNVQKVLLIRALLQELGLPFTEKKSCQDTFQFSIYSKSLYQELEQWGKGARQKRVPSYIRTLSPRQIRIFLDSFMLGDGWIHKGNRTYATSSFNLANDIQELVLLTGNYASLRAWKDTRKVWIQNHWAQRGGDFFRVNEWKVATEAVILCNNLREMPYDGMVYCVTVEPHHLIYTRRNGKCLWMGNSGVTDITRAQGYAVEGVNVQNAARQRSKFANIHDEMWWTVREKLRVGDMALPDDDKMIADLTAMRRKGHDLQGRPMFEKKEDMMKRLGRSPDSGDALALSYADAGFIGSMAGDYADDLHTQSRWALGEKAEREVTGTEDWGLAADKRPSRWRVGRLPRRSW